MKQHIAIDKATPNVGALEFSHLLDAPAGKHGHVTVKDDHFYFADGTRARFIGFNLPPAPTRQTMKPPTSWQRASPAWG